MVKINQILKHLSANFIINKEMTALRNKRVFIAQYMAILWHKKLHKRGKNMTIITQKKMQEALSFQSTFSLQGYREIALVNLKDFFSRVRAKINFEG